MPEINTPIAIKSSCNGSFVVDSEGIRSEFPIELKSAEWIKHSLSGPVCGDRKSSYSNSFFGIFSNIHSRRVFINGVDQIPQNSICSDSKSDVLSKLERSWDL